ncbi:unnamed protein product [Amoebophrya sp. A25]|nr:unnamed protein product [Amoebophrya sp. A25]|eukprot:GSA25T00017384001.1
MGAYMSKQTLTGVIFAAGLSSPAFDLVSGYQVPTNAFTDDESRPCPCEPDQNPRLRGSLSFVQLGCDSCGGGDKEKEASGSGKANKCSDVAAGAGFADEAAAKKVCSDSNDKTYDATKELSDDMKKALTDAGDNKKSKFVELCCKDAPAGGAAAPAAAAGAAAADGPKPDEIIGQQDPELPDQVGETAGEAAPPKEDEDPKVGKTGPSKTGDEAAQPEKDMETKGAAKTKGVKGKGA